MSRQQRYRERHLERERAYGARWRANNAHKRSAHQAVQTALDRSELTRPSACQKCGAVGMVQAHHHDYSKPLAVEWICAKCHSAEHGGFPKCERRVVSGTDCPWSKLTKEQVLQIRAMTGTRSEIARKFGVNPSLVSQIVRGKIWKSI